ncbi:MAG: SIMPL domain-containing protein [Saprospiraceae bacterium]
MRIIPVLIILLINISLLAQQIPMNKTVTITAKSEMNVNPDQVVYSININQKRKSFEEAYDALDKEINNAIDMFLKEKIDKDQIKTVAYNVQKNYRWTKGKRSDDGFVATSRLEAKNKLDTRKINKVISRFAKGSPDLTLNIGFSISDDLMEESNEKLLTKTIKRAQKKARRICDALGKKVDDIVSVEYNEGGGQRPVYYQQNMMKSRSMDESESHYGAIENVKEVKINLSVHTVWAIL